MSNFLNSSTVYYLVRYELKVHDKYYYGGGSSARAFKDQKKAFLFDINDIKNLLQQLLEKK